MFQVMRLHHKNKPLGMQTFLGRVVVIAIEIHMVLTLIGTILCLTLELFMPLGEIGASVAVITGKQNVYIFYGLNIFLLLQFCTLDCYLQVHCGWF